MEQTTQYFEDTDKSDTIVRKRQGVFELEYISKRKVVWTKTIANSSYEREYYFGEGNSCLFPISYEEAKKRLAEFGVKI